MIKRKNPKMVKAIKDDNGFYHDIFIYGPKEFRYGNKVFESMEAVYEELRTIKGFKKGSK